MDIDLSNKRMTVFVSVIESVSFDFSENNIYHEDHDDIFGNFLQVSLFFANHIEEIFNHLSINFPIINYLCDTMSDLFVYA